MENLEIPGVKQLLKKYNMKTKVEKITNEFIQFDNKIKLLSEHDQDCCEHHYLDFKHLKLEDFENLEFDLNSDNFFTRIDGYGIQLNPLQGFPIRIPGYGFNNGYYSSQLTLVLTDDKSFNKTFDISNCQVIED